MSTPHAIPLKDLLEIQRALRRAADAPHGVVMEHAIRMEIASAVGLLNYHVRTIVQPINVETTQP